jgi:hypothetical protein
MQMGLTHPLGVGLRQYEQAYDEFDTTFGRYGKHRAVHSAHVQVFAELGFFGAIVWVGLFAYSVVACLRVRQRSFNPRLPPLRRKFLLTASIGLLTSMVGFMTGGAFLALALNDLTWLTFAMVAALERLSLQALEPETVGAPAVASAPLAFRVVGTFTPPGTVRA